ncbi:MULTISPECIES: RNA methyltransferase [unclassified Exiguobacterium]|uniref:TrmH family RNA methyltransferase n=1 Tax=unclassified Exiguobacterium TaxID=2644629 RepID=UPI00103C5C02|nr:MULTISPECIES: RNA methyltransferase [unclassified Exiguobacterium]TCI25761.1 RNA methyltransferase [Exiguobacterium sp. SH5S4]TCI50734.1 RNA methyltransferase [Exiguobacterium sp. SH5S13]TCI62236.1 RNA methyltransferase [Exiguobacterium sp. SH3S1]
MGWRQTTSALSQEEQATLLEELLRTGVMKEEDRLLFSMLMPDRVKRMQDVLNTRTNHITVLTEGVDDPHNQSAVLRSADAFGVQTLHVVEGRAKFKPNSIIAKSADRWVDVVEHASIEEAIDQLKADGYQILATALSEEAIPLEDVDVSKPTVLLFGNEHHGVSEQALAKADGNYVIPMQGYVQSLNISVAAAISLYDVTTRARHIVTEGYGLSIEDKQRVFKNWMVRSLPKRSLGVYKQKGLNAFERETGKSE